MRRRRHARGDRAFEATLAAESVRAKRLRVPRAYHSHLFDGALAEFRAIFTGITLHAPTIPFLSNVTGTWITDEQARDAAYWCRHLRETVRFADGLRELTSKSGRVFLEVGPSQTTRAMLLALAGQELAHVAVATLPRPDAKEGDVRAFYGAAATLWVSGVAVAWAEVASLEGHRRIPVPTYPFERERHWIEPGARTSGHTRAPESAELATPADDAPTPSAQPLAVAPRNETEAAVAALWQEVLGYARVSVTASFFDFWAETR